MEEFFLRIIGSLDLSLIVHEVKGPEALKTEGAKLFEKILMCLKTGQNDPKCPEFCLRPLWQHFFMELAHKVFLIFL